MGDPHFVWCNDYWMLLKSYWELRKSKIVIYLKFCLVALKAKDATLSLFVVCHLINSPPKNTRLESMDTNRMNTLLSYFLPLATIHLWQCWPSDSVRENSCRPRRSALLFVVLSLLIIFSTRRPLIPYSIQLANHHHDHPHRLPDLQMLWAGKFLQGPPAPALLTKVAPSSLSHDRIFTIT